jgi:ATP-dependent DNA helicase RecG
MMDGDEIGALLKQERGQFLEFLSAFEHGRGNSRKKADQDLVKQIARIVSAMANADGGTLLVGVEPDKSITGVAHNEQEIQGIIHDTLTLLAPPVTALSEKLRLGNLLLLKFEVAPSLGVSRVANGRSFYRIAAESPALPAEQIQSLKDAKRNVAYERQQPMDAAWEHLDGHVLEIFAAKLNDPRPPEQLLRQTYHLSDNSRRSPSPTLAALLLFGKEPALWHPRCGIDFVKYEGIERRHGAALNVVKRIRFEAPLARLIDEAVGRIKEHIRERTILHDLFFRERLEYPAFAWQEALVNAVAHRDYAITGASVEIWMFDDRLEVRSPGLPPAPVTLEQLRQHKSIHFSRNPLLVRALADMGYMNEIGEGIPRMFEEMEHHGLQPPEFALEGFFVVVTLRNSPVYDDETLRWLNQFAASRLNLRQRRLLAYAYCHGKTFSTAEYERIAEVDRDLAYRDIRALVKSGIVVPLKPKSRSYRIIEQL